MTLPLYIIRKSKKWYLNTKTGKYILAANIGKYQTQLKLDLK